MTWKEMAICRKFSKHDSEGKVHCNECPLQIDKDSLLCKANSRYDRRKKEWVLKVPKICQTCKWWCVEVCTNAYSEHRADFTFGHTSCSKWEEKDD